MAPALVQKTNSSGSSATPTINLTGVTAGNTLLCFVGWNNTGSSSCTAKENNTNSFTQDYFPASLNATRVIDLRLQSATGGTTTINLTFPLPNQLFWDAVIFEVSGLVASPYDASVSANAGATTASITLTAAAAGGSSSEIYFVFVDDTGADDKWLPNSTAQTAGWVTTDPANALTAGNGYGSSHLIASSVVTPNPTLTGSAGSGTVGAQGMIVGYQGAAGASDPFPAGYGWLGQQQQNAVYRMRNHFYIPETVLWLPERRHIVIEEQP